MKIVYRKERKNTIGIEEIDILELLPETERQLGFWAV